MIKGVLRSNPHRRGASHVRPCTFLWQSGDNLLEFKIAVNDSDIDCDDSNRLRFVSINYDDEFGL